MLGIPSPKLTMQFDVVTDVTMQGMIGSFASVLLSIATTTGAAENVRPKVTVLLSLPDETVSLLATTSFVATKAARLETSLSVVPSSETR